MLCAKPINQQTHFLAFNTSGLIAIMMVCFLQQFWVPSSIDSSPFYIKHFASFISVFPFSIEGYVRYDDSGSVLRNNKLLLMRHLENFTPMSSTTMNSLMTDASCFQTHSESVAVYRNEMSSQMFDAQQMEHSLVLFIYLF